MAAQRPARRLPLTAEKVTIPFSHAALTASKTLKCFSVPAGRQVALERVSYQNDTGLAIDPTNDFRCEVKNGATVASTVFNTDTNDTPAGAALVAGTWVEGVPSATASDTWFDAGASVDVVITLEGTQTLPTGNGVLELRLY